MATTLALGCAHAPRDEGALAWHYEVTPAAALDRLDVKLCFRDRVPTRLVADDEHQRYARLHGLSEGGECVGESGAVRRGGGGDPAQASR